MAKKDLTDEQIKGIILYLLARKGCWGGSYKPYDSILSWIEGRLKKNGKRVKKAIDNLVKNGYLLTKLGKT